MPIAKVNNIEIYYELHGPKDGDVIVLSNGVMMSTASWAGQKEALSKNNRLVLYDCRGMWQSSHPEGPYSMEEHAEDLKGLMDVLSIEKAHIAGISYGSEVSMMFALLFPERTKSLIVIDGVSYVDPFLKAQSLPWLRSAEMGNYDLLMETSVHLNFSKPYFEKYEKILTDSSRMKSLNLSSFIELMKVFYNFDIRMQLKDIKVPTLVIVAEHDLIKTVAHAEIIYKNIPKAEWLIIPDSGHAVCIEKPKELNTAILEFVEKHA